MAGSANVVALPGRIVGAVTKAGLLIGSDATVRLACETIAGNHPGG